MWLCRFAIEVLIGSVIHTLDSAKGFPQSYSKSQLGKGISRIVLTNPRIIIPLRHGYPVWTVTIWSDTVGTLAGIADKGLESRPRFSEEISYEH